LINKNFQIKVLVGKIKGFKKQTKNLSLYLLASISSSFIGVIINPFLAANLSPEDYAIIGYFTSFNILILPILSFSLISYYSRNYFRIKEEERQTVLDTLLVMQMFLGLIGLILVLVGFYIYMQIAEVNFEFFPYALMCFIPVFFNCFLSFLLVEMKMKRQALSYFKFVLINAILGASFAILLIVILKKGAIGRFWATLIPTTAVGIFSFFRLLSKFQINKKVIQEAVAFGWPISVSAILYYFLSGIDRAMLEELNDITTFGIYNVAVQISGYLYIFYSALIQTFEPDIFKTIVEDNRKKLFKIVMGIIILNAIPTLLFILLAQPLVSILTYGRYIESTTFAQILAIKNIALAFCFLVSDVIIGYGYPKVELINRAFGAFLSIIMFKILINKFGFYGAAWGQSIAFILMTSISGFFVIYKLITHKEK
jgi:O-antigen/teichoic acid export membrane protein